MNGKAMLSYRRNQVTYKAGMSCPDQLIGGIIFAKTSEARDAWIKRLNRHWQRFNYFVRFNDVQGYALQFGCDWNFGPDRLTVIR
jgi:hypothetical protein